MRTLTLLAAGTAMALAAPAMAQDTSEDGFNGVYVQAAVGKDVQNNDTSATVLFDRNLDGRYDNTVLTGAGANAFAPSAAQPGAGFCNGQALGTNRDAGCRNDKDGWGYYGRIGWDQQYGSLVVGVLGEFGTSKIRDYQTAYSVTPAAYVFTRELDWEASARARVGYTPNNTTLFYGTFGPSYAKIDSSYTQTQTTNPFAGRGNDKEWGINGGGGVEQRLGNFTIGLEYMYHQYNDDDYRVRLTGAAGTPFTNGTNGGTVNGTDLRRSDDRFNWHSIRATVGYRF